jgi:hypothetical protein
MVDPAIGLVFPQCDLILVQFNRQLSDHPDDRLAVSMAGQLLVKNPFSF